MEKVVETKTITFHNPHNYGAVLQAYALQQTILGLGFKNEIIDYAQDKNNIFNKNISKSIRGNISIAFNNLMTLIKYKELKQLHNKFNDFINNYLKLTRKYKTFDELKNNPPNADCYIAGSDQVWNTSVKIKPEFFLDFGCENIKRISYAASIGTNNINKSSEKIVQNYLNRFDKISVREKNAKPIIEDLINKEISVNIDPTLLLDKEKWSSISKSIDIKEKYILCYPLIHHSLINPSLEKLKKLTGYEVIVVTTSSRTKIKGDRYIRNAGPREFLWLIQNAEYVVTSSFHGNAFSVIFEKKFFSFLPSHSPYRAKNLLKKLGLENRIIDNLDKVVLDDIDYTYTKQKIQEEKDNSIKYLKNAMGYLNE